MKNEAFLNGLLGVIKQPVFAKDENFLYTFCNQAFADYLGKTEQEIIGRNVFQLFTPENAEIYHQSDRQLFESGSTQQYETIISTLDGTEHHSIIYKDIITDNKNSKIGIIGLIEDVTELKENEKKLNETESKYKKIFENIQDVFYQIDLNGIITDISPSVEKYTPYTRQEIIGQHIDKLYLNPGDRKLKIKEIEENGEVLDYEIQIKGLNNEVYYASDNAHFIYDEKGQISGVEGTLRDLTERKLSDEKLKLSLSLLQATLDSTTDGILVVDNSGKITNFNKKFKAIFNVPDEILESGDGSATLEYVFELFKYPEQFISKVQYLYKNLDQDSFDILEFRDGRVLERFSCPQLLDGKPIGRVWSFRDVTEQKRSEQALKESENRYRLLIENQGEGLTIVDPHENLIFVNPAAEVLFGVEPGTLIHRNLKEFVDPEQFDQIRKETEKRTKNEKSSYEIDILTPTGVRKNILVTATPQTDENGKYIGTFGVIRNITDRKQAEEMLRQSEVKYRNLIETMPDGVYRSTHEGKFVEVNPAMVKMLGYESKEDLMAIDIKSQLYFAPEDRESLVLDTRSHGLDVFPMKKKDGSTVWIEDHGWYLKDDQGQILFHEGILRDVTERKMTEIQLQKYSEELQELNATKDKFFSIIAHDLKNPFSSIVGFSEILKDEAKHLDIETIEQYAEVLHSTAKNTYRLLENLLDWARVQQSGMPFRPESIILKTIVSEVVELMVEKANSKSITIINHIPDNLIVRADEDMLKTILRNLVSNALKYTSANGKVEIKAVSLPDGLEITVKDSGTGIKKEDIGKIFKVGSNYSRRGTENEIGTGLGLLLCKEFVEKHGGKIWVESDEGKGSEFKFILPLS